jgi:hypothetical protein
MKRSTAKELGASTYFTGKLCSRGHNSYRYTANGQCIKCSAENAAKYQKNLRDASRSVITSVSFRVHPDDVEMLKAFALMLGMQR